MLRRVSYGMNVPSARVVCAKHPLAIADPCIRSGACALVEKGLDESARKDLYAEIHRRCCEAMEHRDIAD